MENQKYAGPDRHHFSRPCLKPTFVLLHGAGKWKPDLLNNPAAGACLITRGLWSGLVFHNLYATSSGLYFAFFWKNKTEMGC
jgi:hypothetical protein